MDGAISETSEKLKATDGLETYTANGVSVQADPYEAVPNYGTAFAPYFIDVYKRQILKHIMPNILGPIVVTAALDVGAMIMNLAGLSYLGLGVVPPTPEWGSMMSEGRSMLQTSPWIVLAPVSYTHLYTIPTKCQCNQWYRYDCCWFGFCYYW